MLFGLSLALLSGCGGSSEDQPPPQPPASSAQPGSSEGVPEEVFEDQSGRDEAFAALEAAFGQNSSPQERCAAMTDAYRESYVEERKVIEDADPVLMDNGSIGQPVDEDLTCEEAAEPAQVESLTEYADGSEVSFEDNDGSFLFYMSRGGVGCEVTVNQQEDGSWLVDEPSAVDIDRCTSR
jgi:hypothetical protein